jgi:murein DD-endopeptidase MepM/ murein hydrolase activator NlpD
LREVRHDLKVGQVVKAGEPVAVMGRTANTRESITKDRAHVHFELNLLVNDRFAAWHKQADPGQRNDHGEWNGQNLLGIDPRLVLLGQQDQGAKFSLLSFLQNQTELCRVLVRKVDFPWVKRYTALIRPNPRAATEGIAGYEIALNFNGVAFELVPRAASEIKGKAKFQLVSVNEAEYHKNPARRLVAQKGKRWELTSHGLNQLELLTF